MYKTSDPALGGVDTGGPISRPPGFTSVPPAAMRGARERSKKCKTWDQTTWNDMGLPGLLSELDAMAMGEDVGFGDSDSGDHTTTTSASSLAALAGLDGLAASSRPPAPHHHARHTSLMGLELKSAGYASWLGDLQDAAPSYAADDLKADVPAPSLVFGASTSSSSSFGPRAGDLLPREPVEEPGAAGESALDPEDRGPNVRAEDGNPSSAAAAPAATSPPPASAARFAKRRSVTFAGNLESIAAAAAAAAAADFDPALDAAAAAFRGPAARGAGDGALRKAFPPTIFDSAASGAQTSTASSASSGSQQQQQQQHARGHQRATSESAVFLSIAALGGLPSIPASPRDPVEWDIGRDGGVAHNNDTCSGSRSSSSSDRSSRSSDPAAQNSSPRDRQSSGIESGPSGGHHDAHPQRASQRRGDAHAADQRRDGESKNAHDNVNARQQPPLDARDFAASPGYAGFHGYAETGMHGYPMGMQVPAQPYAGHPGYGAFPVAGPGAPDLRMATAEQLHAIQTMQNRVMMQWIQMQEQQQRLIMMEQQRIAASAAAANGMYYQNAPMGPAHRQQHMPPHMHAHMHAQAAAHMPMMPVMMGGALPPKAQVQAQHQGSQPAATHRSASASSPQRGQNGHSGAQMDAGTHTGRGNRGSRAGRAGRANQQNAATRNGRVAKRGDSSDSSDSRRGSQSPDRPEGSRGLSTLLQQHKHAGARPSIEELKGHVVEFACDSHGSRHIQFLNDNAAREEREILLQEALREPLMLMKDVFANYVIQNLLVHCGDDQRLLLLEAMQGRVVELALDQYGTRVVQRALEVASPEWRRTLVGELCTDDDLIRRSACDANATHVLQRVVDLLVRNGGDKAVQPRGANVSRGGGRSGNVGGGSSSSRRGTNPLVPRPKLDHLDEALITSLERAIAAEAVPLSRNQHASRLVLLVLGDCDTKRSPYIASIMDSLEKAYPSLVWDQHGVFAAGHILASGTKDQVEKLQRVVAAHVLDLAKHKFGSHLVEKALMCAADHQVTGLVEPILDQSGVHAAKLGLKASPPESDGSVILHLAKDPYGNFVVSKAYEVSAGDLRDRLFNEVNARANVLSRFTYGRHILNHVNK